MRACSGSLLRTAVLLAGDYGHAEDLLQVALLRTARRWRTARASPEAYVRQALVNLCRDRWRRLKARPREVQMLPGSSVTATVIGPAEQVSQQQLLVQALLPTPDMLAALRRRRARRARATAPLITVPVAAAAIAAAVFLPGPAAPAAQDTAYVVSHVTQALDAMPADTILFSQITRTGSDSALTDTMTDTWANDGHVRMEIFTRAGQLTSEFGSVTTRTAHTAVIVNYLDKTWSRSANSGGHAAGPATSFTCASVSGEIIIFHSSSQMAAWLRAAVSCGTLKADGTATVDGVTAIKLIRGTGITYFVNPTSYLPVRLTLTTRVEVFQDDFRWLAPTAANLARLNLPVPPAGFTQVSR